MDSNEVIDKLIEEIKAKNNTFICANIQETDLAGHQEDAKRYGNRLEVVDRKLKNLEKTTIFLFANRTNITKIVVKVFL